MEKDNIVTCGSGWKSLYQPIIDKIINYDKNKTDFTQKIGITTVKEKFGWLDIETAHPLNVSSTLHDEIKAATSESDKTCEFCGTKENVGHAINGFRKTCCESCFDKYVHPNCAYTIWSSDSKYNLR